MFKKKLKNHIRIYVLSKLDQSTHDIFVLDVR